MCFNRGCAHYGKSIPRARLEGEFEVLLSVVQPSRKLFELAREMFSHAWNMQLAHAWERAKAIAVKVREADKEIEALLDRIVDATNPTAFEKMLERIASLERKKLVLRENGESADQPVRPFEEMFELSLRFLASPWNILKKGATGAQKNGVETDFRGAIGLSPE